MEKDEVVVKEEAWKRRGVGSESISGNGGKRQKVSGRGGGGGELLLSFRKDELRKQKQNKYLYRLLSFDILFMVYTLS